jgi:hypothetical protein
LAAVDGKVKEFLNGFTIHQEKEKDFQLYTARAALRVVYSAYSLILHPFMIFRSIGGGDTLHRDSSSHLYDPGPNCQNHHIST